MKLKLDCRHFRGDKPCIHHCGCEGCLHYFPMGERILIIKLDAIGDVARTTPILQPLHRAYKPCHITWLTHPIAEEMLRGNPLIDVLLAYRPESLEPLRVQRFDRVLSLDKTPRAAAVAEWVNAGVKIGFGLSRFGTLYPFNKECEYAFQLGLDDDLKFRRNTRSYQEVLFECVGLKYERDEYVVEIDANDRRHADALLAELGVTSEEALVGLNMGGGSAFANKMWSAARAVEFIRALLKQVECKVLLFGAEREGPAIEEILRARLPRVFSAGTGNSVRQFQALVGRCTLLVTGDSLGMHLAIAERRPAVVLFGPTCAQEIELYDRGAKVVSPAPCIPCYRPTCEQSPTCMEGIKPGPVLEAVKRWLAHEKKLKLL